MKAIGFNISKRIDEEGSLFEFDAPIPTLRDEHDIIVRVAAISVNPADAKIRSWSAGEDVLPEPKILGYDAVGEITELASEVRDFQIGDRVYYCGDMTRQGSNAEFQSVDSRVVAKAPSSLNDAEAAALPLTCLTAWEGIFDHLKVEPEATGKTLLIIGGAGGVGSAAIQIAKQMTNLTVIATASRPETEAWVTEMGSDYVANHRDLVDSVRGLGFEVVDYILNLADTPGYWEAGVELIAPRGTICSAADCSEPVALGSLLPKAVTFSWVQVFNRPMFVTPDITRQRDILQQLAELVDSGRIKTTLQETMTGLTVNNLKQGHRLVEAGENIGKLAVVF